MADHWDSALTRVLTTKAASSERLETLRQAGAFVAERFPNTTHSAVLEHAVTTLMRAAETGTAADREAATDQVTLLLKGRGWL